MPPIMLPAIGRLLLLLLLSFPPPPAALVLLLVAVVLVLERLVVVDDMEEFEPDDAVREFARFFGILYSLM